MSYSMHTPIPWGQTYRELADAFGKWGVTDWHVEAPREKQGRGRYAAGESQAVTVRYDVGGRTVSLMMDKQERAVDNLRVLYLAIEAMRMNDKRGITDVIANAYLQLDAPVHKRDPYEVLGIFQDSPLEIAEAVYKAKVKKAHPDAGGSVEQMKELNDAIEELRHGK